MLNHNIPTVKPVNPSVGQTMYDTKTHTFMVYDGINWIMLHAGVIPFCVVCKKQNHEIIDMVIPDHPYCSNNLEYLEWVYDKKTRV